MYLPIKTWLSTRRNWDSCTPDQQSALTDELAAQIAAADAVVVGGGAGLSAAAGFAYEGLRFEKHFADFRRAYGIRDMYSGGFYPYKTLEEYWAWWSRAIWVNRYDVAAGKPYHDLLSLVAPKDYFVLTTNVNHQVSLLAAGSQKPAGALLQPERRPGSGAGTDRQTITLHRRRYGSGARTGCS